MAVSWKPTIESFPLPLNRFRSKIPKAAAEPIRAQAQGLLVLFTLGLGMFIGAKAAAPDRPAVSYAGDGAWAMSMVEVMTAVRHDIPVTAIVFHNRQWGAEKKNQVDFYGRRFVAGELGGGEDYSEIARAMGADGVRVDQLDEVGPALEAAIDAQMNEGRTTVIEIMCTKELGDPFRKDAMSIPVRHLEKYADYV